MSDNIQKIYLLVDTFLQINTLLGQKIGTPAFLDKAIKMTHINTVLGSIHKFVKAAADLILHNPTLKKVSVVILTSGPPLQESAVRFEAGDASFIVQCISVPFICRPHCHYVRVVILHSETLSRRIFYVLRRCIGGICIPA